MHQQAVSGLLCYWCSGVGSDRECELRPEAVSTGPVFINCREKHCVSTKVIDVATGRVQSFARFCDRSPRGNVCVRDSKLVTCYESCKDDLCNHGNPDPGYLPLVSYASYDVIARYSEHRIPSGSNGGVDGNVGDRILSAAAARQRIGWWNDESAETVRTSTRSRPFQRPQLWREEEEKQEEDRSRNALQVAARAPPTERVSGHFQHERTSSGRPDFGRSSAQSSHGGQGSPSVGMTTEERPGARGNSILIEEDAEEGRRTFDSGSHGSYGSPYSPPSHWSGGSRRTPRPAYSRTPARSPSFASSPSTRVYPSAGGRLQATTQRLATTTRRLYSTRRSYGREPNPAVNVIEKEEVGQRQGYWRGVRTTTAAGQIRRMMTGSPFTRGPYTRTRKDRRLKVAASRRRPERVQAPESNGNSVNKKSGSDAKETTTRKWQRTRRPPAGHRPRSTPSTAASTTSTATSTSTSSTTSTSTTSTRRTAGTARKVKTTTTKVPRTTTRKATSAPSVRHTTTTSANKAKKPPVHASASASAKSHESSKKKKTSGSNEMRSPFAPPEKNNHRFKMVGHKKVAKVAKEEKKEKKETKNAAKSNDKKKSALIREKVIARSLPSTSSPRSRKGRRPSRGKARHSMRLTTAQQKTTVPLATRTTTSTTTTTTTTTHAPSTARPVKSRRQNVKTKATVAVRSTTETTTETTQRTTPSTIPTTTLFPKLHGFDINGPQEYEEMARMKPWVRPLFQDLGSMLHKNSRAGGDDKKEVEVKAPNSPAGKSGFPDKAEKKKHWGITPSQSSTASATRSNSATSPSSAQSSQRSVAAGKNRSRAPSSTQKAAAKTGNKANKVPVGKTAAQERPRKVVKANNKINKKKNDNRSSNKKKSINWKKNRNSGEQKMKQSKRGGRLGLTTTSTPSIIAHPVRSSPRPAKAKGGLKKTKTPVDRDFVQNPVSRRGPGSKEGKKSSSGVVSKSAIDWQFYRDDLVAKSKNKTAPLKRLDSPQAPETGVWYSGYSPSARLVGFTPHSRHQEELASSTKVGPRKSGPRKSHKPSSGGDKAERAGRKDKAAKEGRFGKSESSIITHPVRNINTTPTGSVSKATTTKSGRPTAVTKKTVTKDIKGEKKPKQKHARFDKKSQQAQKPETNSVHDKSSSLKSTNKDVKGTGKAQKGNGKAKSTKPRQEKPTNAEKKPKEDAQKEKKSPFRPGRHYKRPRKIAQRGEKSRPLFQTTPASQMKTTARMNNFDGAKWNSRNTPRRGGAKVHDKDFFRTTAGTAYPPQGPGPKEREGKLKSLPVFLSLDSKKRPTGTTTTSALPLAGPKSKNSDSSEKTVRKTGLKSPYAPPTKGLDVMAQRRGTERVPAGSKSEVGSRGSKSFSRTASKESPSAATVVRSKTLPPTEQTPTSSEKVSRNNMATTTGSAASRRPVKNNRKSKEGSTRASTTAKRDRQDDASKAKHTFQSPYQRPQWTDKNGFASISEKPVTKESPKKSNSAPSRSVPTSTAQTKVLTPVTAIHASSPSPKPKPSKKTASTPQTKKTASTPHTKKSASTPQTKKTTPSSPPTRKTGTTSRAESKTPRFTPKLSTSKQPQQPQQRQRPGLDLSHFHEDERDEVLRLIPNLKDDAIIWPREPKDVEERIISKVILEEDAEEVLHQALPRKSLSESEANTAQGGEEEESEERWVPPSSQGLSGAKEGEQESDGDASSNPSSSADSSSNGQQPPLFTGSINSTLELGSTRRDSSGRKADDDHALFNFSSAPPLRFLWSLLMSSLTVFVLL